MPGVFVESQKGVQKKSKCEKKSVCSYKAQNSAKKTPEITATEMTKIEKPIGKTSNN